MPSTSSSEDITIPIDYGYSYRQDDARTFVSSRTMATTSTSYRHENGRTYHAFRDGEYWQPNDTQQNNHEAIVHHMCIMMLRDRLYLAPAHQPTKVLDIGTGTGIWATDMADKFTDATVIGIDLSPTQPKAQPSNCQFEIDDCTSQWVYPINHFDFVHIRGLFGSIADWPALYGEIFKHTSPDGHIEQVEWSIELKSPDGSLSPGHPLSRWSELWREVERKSGKSFSIAEDMAGLVRQAGFVDVVEKKFKWPIGPWSSDPHLKEMGRWNLLNWEQGMEGWIMASYTRVLGWTYAQVQTWLGEVRKTLRDVHIHAYHEVRLVYARKPA